MDELASDPEVLVDDVEHETIEIHHRHVPKLADHHYLAYDHHSGLVMLGKDPVLVRLEPDSCADSA